MKKQMKCFKIIKKCNNHKSKRYLKKIVLLNLIIFTFMSISLIGNATTDNIIENYGFEEVENGKLLNWEFESFSKSDVIFKVEESDSYKGKHCVSINNTELNDSRLVQSIDMMPGAVYKISFWYKIQSRLKGGGGVNFSLPNGRYFSKNFKSSNNKWVYFEEYMQSHPRSEETQKFWLRVGGFGAITKGKVYFDDISISKVSNIKNINKTEKAFLPEDNIDEYDRGDIEEINLELTDYKNEKNLENKNQIFMYIVITVSILILLYAIEKIIVNRILRND